MGSWYQNIFFLTVLHDCRWEPVIDPLMMMLQIKFVYIFCSVAEPLIAESYGLETTGCGVKMG